MKTFLVTGFAIACMAFLSQELRADCTASYNCSACNSGGFTLKCECVNTPSTTCTSCSPGGCGGSSDCLRCCSVDSRGGTHCTGANCSGNCANPQSVVPTMGLDPLQVLAQTGPQTPSLQSAAPTLPLLQESAIDPIVDVAAFSRYNLSLSEAKVNLENGGFKSGSYRISNDGDRPIVALAVSFDLYWSDRSQPMRLVEVSDGWFLQAMALGPKADQTQQVRQSLQPTANQQLLRVVVSLDYIEFADGTFFGPGYGTSHAALQAKRQEALTVRSEMLETMKSSRTNTEFMSRLGSRKPLQTENAARQLAYSAIAEVLKSSGVENLKQKLLEKPLPN